MVGAPGMPVASPPGGRVRGRFWFLSSAIFNSQVLFLWATKRGLVYFRKSLDLKALNHCLLMIDYTMARWIFQGAAVTLLPLHQESNVDEKDRDSSREPRSLIVRQYGKARRNRQNKTCFSH